VIRLPIAADGRPSEPPTVPGIAYDMQVIVMGEQKGANGLTPRQDAMARWIAAGSSISDAYRAAYCTTTGDTKQIADHASHVAGKPPLPAVVAGYRREWAEASQYKAIDVRNTVMSGLHSIATDTGMPPAVRVRALELLGKTEALFTDVRRVERTSDSDAKALKSLLEQRLSAYLRHQRKAVPLAATTVAVNSTELALEEPHPMGTPPLQRGGPAHVDVTNQLEQPDNFSSTSLDGGSTTTLQDLPPKKDAPHE
jgi:hypothetical protein